MKNILFRENNDPIRNRSTVVYATGGLGVDSNMREAQSMIRDAGTRLGSAAMMFAVQKIDTENKLASTQARDLYRQTFFLEKEENLHDWDRSVSEEQRRKIEDRLKAERLYVDDDSDKAAECRELKKRKNAGEDIPEKEFNDAYEKAGWFHPLWNVTGTTASKAGYRVERVNENAGREFNAAKGTVCVKNAIFSASELPKTGKMKWIKERLLDYSKEHEILGSHETPCLGSPVKVTKGSISNDLNHWGTAIRQNMISVIPEMLKNAVLIQTETDERSKTHILVAKVRYGEERFAVGLVINESDNKYFYDHELIELDAIADGTSDKTDASQTKASILTVIRKALLSSGFDKKDGRNILFPVGGDAEFYNDGLCLSLGKYSEADGVSQQGTAQQFP